MNINTPAIRKSILGLSAVTMVSCGALLMTPRENNKHSAKIEDAALILGTISTLGTMGMALVNLEQNKSDKAKLEEEFHKLVHETSMLIVNKNISHKNIRKDIDLVKLNESMTKAVHSNTQTKAINNNLKEFIQKYS